MTIYQNDTGIVFRLDTNAVNLASATKIEILVRKPGGTIATWTATQYTDPVDGPTSYITYTSTTGDLTEAGDYILQAHIEWGTDVHYGESTVITVYSVFATRANTSQLLRYFSVYYRDITVQNLTEHNTSPEAGTDSEMLFDEFELFSEQAVDELENIVASKRITLTNVQRYVALCHLVADYFEMTNPDWNFRSQSMGSGVSFSRAEETGPREALNKLLDKVKAALDATSRPSVRMGSEDLVKIKDSTHYPRRFKKTAIPAWDFTEDGFDSAEVFDNGSNYEDRTY